MPIIRLSLLLCHFCDRRYVVTSEIRCHLGYSSIITTCFAAFSAMQFRVYKHSSLIRRVTRYSDTDDKNRDAWHAQHLHARARKLTGRLRFVFDIQGTSSLCSGLMRPLELHSHCGDETLGSSVKFRYVYSSAVLKRLRYPVDLRNRVGYLNRVKIG